MFINSGAASFICERVIILGRLLYCVENLFDLGAGQVSDAEPQFNPNISGFAQAKHSRRLFLGHLAGEPVFLDSPGQLFGAVLHGRDFLIRS